MGAGSVSEDGNVVFTAATLLTDDGTFDITDEFRTRGRTRGGKPVTVTVVEPEAVPSRGRPAAQAQQSGRVIDADFRDK
jgi:hypothetical protein